jgi:hypothetical protein
LDFLVFEATHSLLWLSHLSWVSTISNKRIQTNEIILLPLAALALRIKWGKQEWLGRTPQLQVSISTEIN